MKRNSKKAAKNPALDLFGDVPVTADEVADWCEIVAGIEPDSPRFPYYVRAWRVVDKIKAAKLAGTFPAIVQRKRADNAAPSRLLAVLSACGA